MCVERTGAVPLAPVDHVTVAKTANGRLDVLHVLAASFRQRVGEPMTLQREAKEMRLLLGRALQANVFQQAIVVLRDLPEGWIRGRNDRDHLRQYRVGHLRTAEFPRHADAPQRSEEHT